MADRKTLPTRAPTPLHVDPESGVLRAREYRLSVQSGDQAGERLVVDRPLHVGSSLDADLVLGDAAVSRLHLRLQPQAGGVWVEDLGSLNGTWAGGARVSGAFVDTDATFKVGETLLRVSLREHEVELGTFTGTGLGSSVGQSPAMRALFALLQRVALTDSAVLLLGETGSGKEVLAEAIHQESPRRDKPFVVLDCGAITPSLIESELFGHARGAFTGASGDRKGALLRASGGTLFLDEIGELPLDLQPRLLRVLERGTFRRLGADEEVAVDLRIIAATHRDLARAVQEGRMRSDLYFRLAVIPVRVPPLRERREDIPLLVRHFLRQLGREDFALSPSLLERFAQHDWPGNVRELRNALEAALAGVDLGFRTPEGPQAAATQESAFAAVPYKQAKEKLLERFTREYLEQLLEQHGRKVSEVARASGLARPYVHELMNKYGLKAQD